jgi:hypothetical protein
MYKTGGAYAMYGDEEKHRLFLQGKLKERHNVQDIGIDGRVILQWISNIIG